MTESECIYSESLTDSTREVEGPFDNRLKAIILVKALHRILTPGKKYTCLWRSWVHFLLFDLYFANKLTQEAACGM